MDFNRTSGKRVSASQRDSFTAQSNRTTIRKPWKSLATVVFGLLLSVPGLTQAQYSFTKIDVPGATGTQANGNSTNQIVGEYDDADGTHGFVWSNGVFTNTKINFPGAIFTSVNGINASGQLTGTYYGEGGFPMRRAFFESNGNFTTVLPQVSNVIRSQGGFINAQGQAVGAYRDATKAYGFIWRNFTFTTLQIDVQPEDFATVPMGINDIGMMVGDYVDKNGGTHGFLRSRDGAFKPIDVPDAILTVAEGINNPGTIVGLYQTKDGSFHGFVSKNGVVFTTVDVPDSSGDTEITSINAKGEIVGFYFNSKGEKHGFLGVPAR
jgi:probable HAF family extracellular repeat protein